MATGNKLIFKDAEAAKNAIMDSQKKEIAKLYEDWADEIGEKAKFYSHKSNASAPVSERYYKELQKQLKATSQEVSNEVYSKIKKNMYTVADAVVADNVKWLESFGFNKDGLNAAFSYVPDEVVRNLITGQIYDSGWSLSARIWGDNEETLKDIYHVMAQGLAMNKPIYEIAKDLESYVRPNAKLPWNTTGKDGVKIYKKKVDYNAQRLARTLVQHGYQQSFVATTQKNPFITEYIWRSNGSRVCDLCLARDGAHFKKTELPLDHPNGMCVMEPAVVDDMVDQLANWFNSPDGTFPEIDAFAGNFGYEAKPTSTSVFDKNAFINKFGNVNNNNALPTFKSKLSSDEYNEWFALQNAEKKALGYGPGSGKDFWADYTSGKIKSDKFDEFFAKTLGGSSQSTAVAVDVSAPAKTAKEFIDKYGMSDKSPNAWYNSLTKAQKAEAKVLKDQSGLTWNDWYEKHIHSTGDVTQDFVKKYGTSTKSPNAWYNSLTPAQKAEAKALKDKSGLTWNDWYNKNVYAGNGSAPATKTVKAFSSVQDKYLSPYGFSPDNMPTNFDDWSHKINYEQAGEILKSMGTSWSDPHPYQQLMKYYNANLTNANFVDQIVDTTKVATKAATAKKAATTAKKVDDAFDVAAWKESVRKNNLREMDKWTDDWLKTITSTEKSGVRTYTGSAYTDMNEYLRGQRKTTGYADEIKACQSALSKASLPRETIVRRGSGYNMLNELGIGKITPENKNQFIGAIVQDKGFVSTSPSPSGGFSGSIEYVIKLPQGSQAMYVDSISRFQGEEELLINCGGKFMVEDVEFNEWGELKKIYMTLKNLNN